VAGAGAGASARLLSSQEDRHLAPVQLVAIYVGIFIPIAAFLGVYSAMGEGLAVYSSLSREGNYAAGPDAASPDCLLIVPLYTTAAAAALRVAAQGCDLSTGSCS